MPGENGGENIEKWVKRGQAIDELIVFLVRHGETDHNREGRLQGRGGVSLNETGKAQATLIASWLGKTPLDAIYTSDILRARQTASIIARFHPQCSVAEMEELREWDFGEWEGKTHDEILEYDKERREAWVEDPVNLPTPGGESLYQVRDRGVSAMRLIRERNPCGRVAVVSHGALIRAVITAFAGLPLEEALTLRLDLGSVSILRFDEDGCSIEAVGFRPGVDTHVTLKTPSMPIAVKASLGALLGTPLLTNTRNPRKWP
ncbi:MAG TPA: histidine phosphatase family protein [Clostridia bacterium]|nr:histidine phosphatase family protein [Clostridia bacterium]